MKAIKNVVLFALVSIMLFSVVACNASEKETVDYSGEYVETVGQRASITVTKKDDGYDVWVRWPNSAEEVYNWNFSGTFDDDGVMNYTGCEKTMAAKKRSSHLTRTATTLAIPNTPTAPVNLSIRTTS